MRKSLAAGAFPQKAHPPNLRTSMHFLTGHSSVSATAILSLAVV
jgi:hypothetical protein